jgi:hypothetical protein
MSILSLSIYVYDWENFQYLNRYLKSHLHIKKSLLMMEQVKKEPKIIKITLLKQEPVDIQGLCIWDCATRHFQISQGRLHF